MPAPILATKLYRPPPRPGAVLRPRLSARLDAGLAAGHRLTLIAAPAGFGKTTLVSEWGTACGQPVAWLSLDASDSDPARFLAYLVAALQTAIPGIGAGVLAALESPQPPPAEALLTALLNELAAVRREIIVVLDDYHLVEAQTVDQALAFLLEHLPPQMHLVIATREDPQLPLARLRARGQLTELRAADLRFTPAEAAEFLNRVMGLQLSDGDVAALEARTEGWIAGLQLAALSMRGAADAAGFIQSFTGSHHFVLDYLVEEVLGQQPADVQAFLLRTSILDRLCGGLCDAVMDDRRKTNDERQMPGDAPSSSSVLRPSSAVLEHLDHANLFIVPLDNERRWYRYHHLFGDLLRQRLGQSLAVAEIAGLHIRASEWYEANGLAFEAFRHATAANDVERGVRLMESKAMPIHVQSVALAIIGWLESLPKTLRDARPALWWKQASLLLLIGQTAGVEEKLVATETALRAAAPPGVAPDEATRNLIGKIAVARATLAQIQAQPEAILAQARRALEHLHPNNLPYRSTATRTLGFAYYLLGDRAQASQAYVEALALAQAAGDVPNAILASIRLGQIQESEGQLRLAAETYRQILQLVGDYSPPNSPVAYLGLARMSYEWNDLAAADQYGEKSLQLAQQYDQIIDRTILSELFLARLKVAQGDAIGAVRILSQAERLTRQKNFTFRIPDIAAAQALIHLHQGNIGEAAELATQHNLPLVQARVLIAQKNPAAALVILEPLQQQWEEKGLLDATLRAMTVRAIALAAQGERQKALKLLGEALALAEPNGFIRLFVDEGAPMAQLLSQAAARGIRPGYVAKLLTAFGDLTKDERRTTKGEGAGSVVRPASLVEPLSERELEILKLIAHGLSNRAIGERLFLALDTVKGHNRRIFDKLQVASRTEAIACARELGLL
jgi:LuxR family maltose regulon positive regulatory protein